MKGKKLLCRLTDKKLWVAVAAFVSGIIMAFGGTESTAMKVTGIVVQGASVLGYLLTDGVCRRRESPAESNTEREDADERDR